MLNFFSNNWIVSIITGLIVYFIGRVIEGFSNNRRYNSKLASARAEIFSTIRAMVPEDSMPPLGILKTLYRATAKRYQVKEEDLDSLSDILEDIIKEILDTNFLAYEEKLRYSDKLQKLIEPNQSNDIRNLNEIVQELGPAATETLITTYREAENFRRDNRRFTYTYTISTAMALIASTVTFNWTSNEKFEIPKELSTLSFDLIKIVGVISLTVIVIASFVFLSYWVKNKRKKHLFKRKNEKN